MKLRKNLSESGLLQKLHGYGDVHLKHNGDVLKGLNKSMQSSYIHTLRNNTKQNLNESKKYSQKRNEKENLHDKLI